MSEEVKKKAVDMLLSGATLLSEPCPYCKGVRVMKNGDALCIGCGKSPDKEIEIKNQESKEQSPIKQLEEKLQIMTSELTNEKDSPSSSNLLPTKELSSFCNLEFIS